MNAQLWEALVNSTKRACPTANIELMQRDGYGVRLTEAFAR